MRYTIAAALAEHELQLDRDMSRAVEAAVKNFDFQKEVEAIARQCLRDAAESAVKEAINDMKWNPEFRAMLVRHITEALTK